MKRRDLLKLSALASFWLPFGMGSAARAAPAGATTPIAAKFVNSLPIPPAIPAAGALQMSATNQLHAFDAALGAVPTLAYNLDGASGAATYLGPTLIARRGTPVDITFTNRLGTHPLAAWIDPNNGVMGGVDADREAPRIATHLHGGYIDVDSDGEPEDVIPSIVATPSGASRGYHYVNDQQAGTLWYHDHAVGLTRLNVYGGLAGFYLLRDEFDTGDPAQNPIRNLPVGYGVYEIPLVLQDKRFAPVDPVNLAGGYQLAYTPSPPAWMPEFFGDVAVVNGKAWPNLNVEPAIYRFRVVNGSQARYYNLSLSNHGVLYQIGTDTGLLNAPVALNSLLIAPGERVDLLLDFTGSAGTRITLQNDAPAPYPSGKMSVAAGGVPLPELMQFTVGAKAGAGAVTVLPQTLRSDKLAGYPPKIVALGKAAVRANIKPRRRVALLHEVLGPMGMPVVATISIARFDESLDPGDVNAFDDVAADSLEQWEIVNLTGDTHPMHLHLVQFQLLNRQTFNANAYRAALNALPVRDMMALDMMVPVPDLLTNPIPDPAPFLTGQVLPPPPTSRAGRTPSRFRRGR